MQSAPKNPDSVDTVPDDAFRHRLETTDFHQSLETRGGSITAWRNMSKSPKTKVWAARVSFKSGQSERYVIRASMRGQSAEHLLEEANNQTLAASIGLAPRVALVSAESGLMISRLIPGRTLTARDMHDPATAHAAVSGLRSLHWAPFEFAHTHDWLGQVSRRHTRTLKTAVALPDELGVPDEIHAVAEQIRLVLQNTRPSLVPCHSDLVTQNIILSKDRRITFIDWELSGMGDPDEDLATLLWSSNLTKPQIEACFKSYYGETSSLNRDRVWALLALIPFDWCLRYTETLTSGKTSDEQQERAIRKLKRRKSEVSEALENAQLRDALDRLRSETRSD